HYRAGLRSGPSAACDGVRSAAPAAGGRRRDRRARGDARLGGAPDRALAARPLHRAAGAAVADPRPAAHPPRPHRARLPPGGGRPDHLERAARRAMTTATLAVPLFLGLSGAFVGDYVATLAAAWPRAPRPILGRSACARCGAPIAPTRAIPLVSWALQR